jgi:protein-L-isoaspartate(D-aspartate) O-methyltransferase
MNIPLMIPFLLPLFGVTPPAGDAASDFAAAQARMVELDLKGRDIQDPRVLKAMAKVPRHYFVPPALRHLAYADRPLPIGSDQTISQPYVVAFMTQSLGLKGHEKVLEIGTGSGYQAAVLSEVAKSVHTIEIVQDLARTARDRLAMLGYTQIQVRAGDGYQGWPKEAPFDAIVITAAPDHIPQPLVDQLKVGGKMILPLGPQNQAQSLVLLTKLKGGKLKRDVIMPVRFVPMTGEAQSKKQGTAAP